MIFLIRTKLFNKQGRGVLV